MKSVKVYWIMIMAAFIFIVMIIPSHAYELDANNDPFPKSPTIEIVNGKEVLHEVSEEPSQEDAEWPIIFSKTINYIDEETGEKYTERTIIRKSPASVNLDQTQSKICPENVVNMQLDCIWQGQLTIETYRSGGGITAHIKHFTDYYCTGIACNIYDPYKVERRWTRSSPSYNVTNAFLEWGCDACDKCGGGDWTYVYVSSPMTPGWKNSTDSYVYTTTITWFDPMTESGSNVKAISNSSQVTVTAPLP